MKLKWKLALAVACLIASSTSLFAQNSPPTYQADPSVYKVIFENENFRVILATWPPGVADKPHSHLLPTVAYALTDCAFELTENGKTAIFKPKAGAISAIPVTPSHTAKNIGSNECRTMFFERK